MSSDTKDDRIRALEEEVQRLTQMLESAPDFITRLTPEGNFLYLNRLAPGFQMSQVLGTSVDAYVPPEFRERARQAMRLAIETGTTQQYATLGQISADKMGHYLTRVSPVVENGKVTSLVLIAIDVTALEESRTLLQVALNATDLGIWTYEPKSGAGSWDDTTKRIFGVTDDAPIPNLGSMLAARVHPADSGLVTERLTAALQTGRYGPLEHRIVRPDGEQRWVAASGITVVDHQGEVVRIVGSVMDITHRRTLEARLLEAQKLESIGRLAGGVAHDFNNMLTAILGNLDFAAKISSIDEIRPLLDEIRLTAERSAALTSQLLAFARRQVIEPKVLEPGALVLRLEALLQRLLGERVFSMKLGSVGHIRADASQLEQVVLNLVTNARDATPQGGSVILETSDVLIEPADTARHPDLAPGAYVLIAVTDDGAGIPLSVLAHVFEPFFTTRPGGTGLGLATCYGIVKQSGGHIAVHSEPGRGATFQVYLPRVAAAEADRTVAVAALKLAAGSERVLLVEDEAVVRTVIERTLERAGYRVVVATTGEEALQSADVEGSFDLLITDVMMPGMTGWELGKRLAERAPQMPILYMSGYTEDVVANGLPFLQKPFLPADLLTAIRRLLDR